jgi:hypothetical protein
VGVFAPSNQSAAKPFPPACSGSVITAWYRDAALTQPWCQDVTSPCPGETATHYCDGSRTPYYRTFCGTCSPN